MESSEQPEQELGQRGRIGCGVFSALVWFVLFTGIAALSADALGVGSEDWPRVFGRVLESELRSDSEGGSTLVLRYSYEVEGNTYEGDDLEIGGRNDFSFHSDATEAASRYAEGSTVEVAVDPKDPTRAVLEPGPSHFYYLLLGLAVVGAVGIPAQLAWSRGLPKFGARSDASSSS